MDIRYDTFHTFSGDSLNIYNEKYVQYKKMVIMSFDFFITLQQVTAV